MKLIIGYTGLIGKELCNKENFDVYVNSSSIGKIRGRNFSSVICAAPGASMFLANRTPTKDRNEINHLISVLDTISAKEFILISSVAVLKNYQAKNELIYEKEEEMAYGTNRGYLENFCQKKFLNHLIIRLPTVFSSGIKKNFIFDIINPVPSMLSLDLYFQIKNQFGKLGNNLLSKFYTFSKNENLFILNRKKFDCSDEKNNFESWIVRTEFSSIRFTSPESIFQPYPLSCLHKDMYKFLKLNKPIIHVSPSPFTANEIFRIATDKEMPKLTNNIHKENMMTFFHKFCDYKSSGYMFGKEEIRKSLNNFFKINNAKIKWGFL